MPEDSLSVTDNRTGNTFELPIENGVVRAMEFRQMKTSEDDFGLMTYDPAFTNTASTKSTITYIDGDEGILKYRGYPIEKLAPSSTYLETAWLVLYGELPTRSELDEWERDITFHTFIHENIRKLIGAFNYDAHPMGIFVSAMAALSTYYPDAKDVFNEEQRALDIRRIVAKVATVAAAAYRHSRGLPFVYPDNDGRWTSSSSSTPTMSRTAAPTLCAPSAARSRTRTWRSPARPPPFTARSTAAPTRRCFECCARSARSTTFPTSSSG
jgi:citrate synthase